MSRCGKELITFTDVCGPSTISDTKLWNLLRGGPRLLHSPAVVPSAGGGSVCDLPRWPPSSYRCLQHREGGWCNHTTSCYNQTQHWRHMSHHASLCVTGFLTWNQSDLLTLPLQSFTCGAGAAGRCCWWGRRSCWGPEETDCSTETLRPQSSRGRDCWWTRPEETKTLSQLSHAETAIMSQTNTSVSW